MSKYHHERRANLSSTGTPAFAVNSKTRPEEPIDALKDSCPLKKFPVVKFVEYSGSQAARKEKQLRTKVAAKLVVEQTSLDVGKEVCCMPSIETRLQLRDPREQLSAKLGLAFQACKFPSTIF